MKKLILAAGFLAYSITSFSQITLNQNNFPVVADTNEFRLLDNTGASLPDRGGNQTWDYGHLDRTPQSNFRRTETPAHPQFPNAVLVRPDIHLALTHEISIFADEYFGTSVSGFAFHGYHIPKQSYSLEDITGNSQDSFKVDDQVIIINPPVNYVAFPLTSNDANHRNYEFSINGTITVTNLFMNNVPIRKKSHVQRIDSVIGWGQLIIPKETMNSIPYDVLMVKTYHFSIDSFYMNNQPAPSMMLGAFGVNQGDTFTYEEHNRISFFREGTYNPLMVITLDEGNIESIFIDEVNVRSVSARHPKFNPALSVFPNPINAGNNVTFSFDKNSSSEYTITVTNLLGQSIATEKIAAGETGKISAKIEIPSSTPAGVYLYHITGNGTILSSGKVMVK